MGERYMRISVREDPGPEYVVCFDWEGNHVETKPTTRERAELATEYFRANPGVFVAPESPEGKNDG